MPVAAGFQEEVGHAVGARLVDPAIGVEGRRGDDVDALGGDIEEHGSVRLSARRPPVRADRVTIFPPPCDHPPAPGGSVGFWFAAPAEGGAPSGNAASAGAPRRQSRPGRC